MDPTNAGIFVSFIMFLHLTVWLFTVFFLNHKPRRTTVYVVSARGGDHGVLPQLISMPLDLNRAPP